LDGRRYPLPILKGRELPGKRKRGREEGKDV